MALTNEDLQAIDSLLEPIRYEIKSIELTLENETNRNIRSIAEGHLDLSRKLDEALKVENEKEMLLLRVNHLENKLRKVKERISQIAKQHLSPAEVCDYLLVPGFSVDIFLYGKRRTSFSPRCRDDKTHRNSNFSPRCREGKTYRNSNRRHSTVRRSRRLQCRTVKILRYLIHTSLHIAGMKRLMRFMTARFPEILVIELLDLWILMRLTDRLRLIVAVQYARTDPPNIRKVTDITGYLRLAAAVDTSARTSHDLNEVIICLACLHLIQQFSGIAKS